MEFIKDNWLVLSIVFINLVLPVAEVVVRLTKTKWDDTILKIVLGVLDKYLPTRIK